MFQNGSEILPFCRSTWPAGCFVSRSETNSAGRSVDLRIAANLFPKTASGPIDAKASRGARPPGGFPWRGNWDYRNVQGLLQQKFLIVARAWAD
jgi:hypothetical protein